MACNAFIYIKAARAVIKDRARLSLTVLSVAVQKKSKKFDPSGSKLLRSLNLKIASTAERTVGYTMLWVLFREKGGGRS